MPFTSSCEGRGSCLEKSFRSHARGIVTSVSSPKLKVLEYVFWTLSEKITLWIAIGTEDSGRSAASETFRRSSGQSYGRRYQELYTTKFIIPLTNFHLGRRLHQYSTGLSSLLLRMTCRWFVDSDPRCRASSLYKSEHTANPKMTRISVEADMWVTPDICILSNLSYSPKAVFPATGRRECACGVIPSGDLGKRFEPK